METIERFLHRSNKRTEAVQTDIKRTDETRRRVDQVLHDFNPAVQQIRDVEDIAKEHP